MENTNKANMRKISKAIRFAKIIAFATEKFEAEYGFKDMILTKNMYDLIKLLKTLR